MLENVYSYGGRTVRSTRFGEDYLDEFRRVIETHARFRHGAVLEWGAGHTTLMLGELHEALGVRRLDSIDHDEAYLEAIKTHMPAWSGFRAHACDLTGTRLGQDDPKLAYSTLPLAWSRRFDVVFIDGRRRLECAFVAALVGHRDTVVVMHDYRRARYQPALRLYDVIEDGPQFRVMRLKPGLHRALNRPAEASALVQP